MGTLTYFFAVFLSCNFLSTRSCLFADGFVLLLSKLCMLNSRSRRERKQQRIKFDKKNSLHWNSNRKGDFKILLGSTWIYGDEALAEKKPQESIRWATERQKILSRAHSFEFINFHTRKPSATHSKIYFLSLLLFIYQHDDKKFLTTDVRRFDKFVLQRQQNHLCVAIEDLLWFALAETGEITLNGFSSTTAG